MNASLPGDVIVVRTLPNTGINGVSLWIVIGCSVGGVLALTMVLAVLMYLRRKRAKTKDPDILDIPTYIPGADFFPHRKSPSSCLSSGSEDTSETWSDRSGNRRPLGHSASLDPPNVLRMTSECVQPKPVLTRWHSVSSPHSQTTTVLGTVENDSHRDSDEDEAGSPTCLTGRIWFSLLYHPHTNKLDVTVYKAKHLPGRGLTNVPRDPYVKLFLLPDEENFQQSKIRKRTLAPKFNETFSFHMTAEEIPHRTLRLSVYDVDKRKVRHSLGHVMISLARTNLYTNEVIWKDLETTSQQSISLGEIQLGLSCNPYTNRIKASVCKLRNIQGNISPQAALFVKVQLFHGRKLIKSKQTTPQHVTLVSENQEIQVDETFHFAVSGRFFDSCSFTFVVMSSKPATEPAAKEETHGRVVIGPFLYARGEQLQHWQEMLTNPRSLITRWHCLEPVQSN